eukprot:147220-Amphidinium_carterae.2
MEEDDYDVYRPPVQRTAHLRAQKTEHIVPQGGRASHAWRSLSPRRRVKRWQCEGCDKKAWGPVKRREADALGCGSTVLTKTQAQTDTIAIKTIL